MGGKIDGTESEVELPSDETEVAEKKAEDKPANAPTLLPLCEVPDDQQQEIRRAVTAESPYPPSVDTTSGRCSRVRAAALAVCGVDGPA